MDLKDAMNKRHVVRKYRNQPLLEETIEKLNKRIQKNNQAYYIDMKLMVNNNKAIHPFIKLLLTKGVNNYIILSGDDSSDLDQRLGYAGADIMLYAQTLGLNTWWIGSTFNRNVSKYVENKKVIGIIVIGYGISQGVPHKSKKVEEVSKYKGDAPDWFVEGVKASLLAPTALNKQDFIVFGIGNKVKIECHNSLFRGANLGLIQYHFELGAGKEKFYWES